MYYSKNIYRDSKSFKKPSLPRVEGITQGRIIRLVYLTYLSAEGETTEMEKFLEIIPGSPIPRVSLSGKQEVPFILCPPQEKRRKRMDAPGLKRKKRTLQRAWGRVPRKARQRQEEREKLFNCFLLTKDEEIHIEFQLK